MYSSRSGTYRLRTSMLAHGYLFQLSTVLSACLAVDVWITANKKTCASGSMQYQTPDEQTGLSDVPEPLECEPYRCSVAYMNKISMIPEKAIYSSFVLFLIVPSKSALYRCGGFVSPTATKVIPERESTRTTVL